MVALSLANGQSITLSTLFKDVVNEEVAELTRYLSSCRNGGSTVCVSNEDAEYPIKGAVFHKSDGLFTAYFAKNLIDMHSREFDLGDFYTVDELCAFAGNNDLKNKTCPDNNCGIGPLKFGEAVALRKAMCYINFAQANMQTASTLLRQCTARP